MSLKGVAKDTLAILERGSYTAPSGRLVSIGAAVSAAVRGTELLTPAALATLVLPASGSPRFEVADETTQVAARRLVADEGVTDLVLLNYASARNAGGGFLSGAKAQEEDLTRCSALYPCLLSQPGYYDANRAESSLLYTDHLIYSPAVPYFRVRSRDVPIEEPYLVATISAPAPNAGQALRHDAHAGPSILETLRRRARYVVAVAVARGHRNLLLGAWGCGVFQNDPTEVAEAFALALGTAPVDRVVFAVPHGVERNHEAFTRRFATTP